MRSPRTGRLREIKPALTAGRIALGRTVPRRGGHGGRTSSAASDRRMATPSQLAKAARAEAARAEAAAAKAEAKLERARRAAPPWAIGQES